MKGGKRTSVSGGRTGGEPGKEGPSMGNPAEDPGGSAGRRLPLADRCLFFMFLVLLVQSAAVMFSPPPEAGGEIDIIVRISSASIFGYLLSGGAVRLSCR